MKIRTIIEENKVTAKNRIYKTGILSKFKERIEEAIENKKCFVTLSGIFGNLCSAQNSLEDYSFIYNDEGIANGNFCGVVNSFDIEEGQGVLDIDFFEGPVKKLIEATGEENFKIDFPLCGTPKQNENGNSCLDMEKPWSLPPFVILVKGELGIRK